MCNYITSILIFRLLGIKANGYYLRQVAVTCRYGTSVVRNLKFLTPFFVFLIITINIILDCISCIQIAIRKEELLVLGIKASGNYIRQVAIIYRCGTSVVRNLKFLTPFFIFLTTIINIILSTNRSYVILPCDTNNYQSKA